MTKLDAGQHTRSASAKARVFIRPAIATPEWQLYDAYLIPDEYSGQPGAWTPDATSKQLAEGVRVPEFAACRALTAQGYSGPVETWRPGDRFPSLHIRSAQSAAAMTIAESARTVATFARFSDPRRVSFIRERRAPAAT